MNLLPGLLVNTLHREEPKIALKRQVWNFRIRLFEKTRPEEKHRTWSEPERTFELIPESHFSARVVHSSGLCQACTPFQGELPSRHRHWCSPPGWMEPDPWAQGLGSSDTWKHITDLGVDSFTLKLVHAGKSDSVKFLCFILNHTGLLFSKQSSKINALGICTAFPSWLALHLRVFWMETEAHWGNVPWDFWWYSTICSFVPCVKGNLMMKFSGFYSREHKEMAGKSDKRTP